MRARTTLLIVFLGGVFVLATVGHGFAAQTTSEQQPSYQQNQENQQYQPGNNSNFGYDLSKPQTNAPPNAAGSPDAVPGIAPGVGNTQQPVASRQVGWGWLLLGLVIGFAVGAVTMGPRRRYTSGEDIRRDRVA
jgi:hypothetical protein